jgi:hypothetical protein
VVVFKAAYVTRAEVSFVMEMYVSRHVTPCHVLYLPRVDV